MHGFDDYFLGIHPYAQGIRAEHWYLRVMFVTPIHDQASVIDGT